MSVRGPNNVEAAEQTDPTLLRYASAITEQKKRWKLLAEKFSPVQTEATLLDVTCCVRLHTLLHVVACCCLLFRKV